MNPLSPLSCKYGAPMGRSNTEDDIENPHFEYAWVPFIDDCYDVGGAYWGLPQNLWCVQCSVDGEMVIELFIRADDKNDLLKQVLEDYPDATFAEKESLVLIDQAIEFLQEYQDENPDNDDLELVVMEAICSRMADA